MLFEVYMYPTPDNLKQMMNVFIYDQKQLAEEMVQGRNENVMRRPEHPGELSLQPAPARDQGPGGVARDDRFVPLEHRSKFIRGIPHAHLHVLSRCGHWAQWEHADAVNRLVLDFLTHRATRRVIRVVTRSRPGRDRRPRHRFEKERAHDSPASGNPRSFAPRYPHSSAPMPVASTVNPAFFPVRKPARAHAWRRP